MFDGFGYNNLTSLVLGDNTLIHQMLLLWIMFYACGYTQMTNIDIGDNFYTSNVENMEAIIFRLWIYSVTKFRFRRQF